MFRSFGQFPANFDDVFLSRYNYLMKYKKTTVKNIVD